MMMQQARGFTRRHFYGGVLLAATATVYLRPAAFCALNKDQDRLKVTWRMWITDNQFNGPKADDFGSGGYHGKKAQRYFNRELGAQQGKAAYTALKYLRDPGNMPGQRDDEKRERERDLRRKTDEVWMCDRGDANLDTFYSAMARGAKLRFTSP